MERLPSALVLHIAQLLGLDHFLRLALVCRSWECAMSCGNADIWLNYARVLRLPFHTSNSHMGLRRKTDFKRVFLNAYRDRERRSVEQHNLMWWQCREFFRKKKCDSPCLLEKCIKKLMPLSELRVDYTSELMERNTLMLLAARHGKLTCVKYLVESLGANMESCDVGGLTALMIFAYRGELLAVKWLLKRGCDFRRRGRLRSGSLMTAEHLAATHLAQPGCRDVFHYLRSVRMTTATPNTPSDDVNPLRPSRHCLCGLEGSLLGKMVACETSGCRAEWYHLECVGLTEEV